MLAYAPCCIDFVPAPASLAEYTAFRPQCSLMPVPGLLGVTVTKPPVGNLPAGGFVFDRGSLEHRYGLEGIVEEIYRLGEGAVGECVGKALAGGSYLYRNYVAADNLLDLFGVRIA